MSLATAVLSCSSPATIENVGDAIERSGRDLQSGAAVEAELEALYEVDGPWLLVFVPRSGLDVDLLSADRVPLSSIARLRVDADGWRGSQMLVQVRGNDLVTRRLSGDAVAIDRQVAIFGHGSAWIQVTLEPNGSTRVPAVARVSTRPAP